MTLRRLSIALILCLTVGLLGGWLLPKFHIDFPWYVLLIGFVVIFAGTMITTDVSAEVDQGKSPETPESYDTDESSTKIEDFEDRRH